ncbi:MAG: hypothetical protein ACKO23_06660 [Gemmataceae bacterium]
MPKSLPYSYCGLLDDKLVEAFPNYGTPAFFDRILAKSLFFGGGLYLNDGYLFMSPAARGHLENANSLLSVMLSQGYVKIFTRCDTVGDLVVLPPDSPVPAHKAFAASQDWQSFRPTWERCVTDAWSDRHVIPWGKPKNHRIQTRFYERLFAKADNPSDLGLTCRPDLLRSMRVLLLEPSDPTAHPWDGAARSKYETALDGALRSYQADASTKEALRRQIMQLGNEAYHYAFGVSLSWQTGWPVAVDTTISKAFDEFIDRPRVEYGNWQLIPPVGVRLDANAFNDGGAFRELMDPFSEAYQTKATFLNALIDTIGSKGAASDWAAEISQRTDDYSRVLARLLKCDPRVIQDTAAGNHTVAVARGVDRHDTEAAATPLANVSVKVAVGDAAGTSIADRIAAFLPADPERPFEFTGSEIVPQITNIALGEPIIEQIMIDPDIIA